MICEKCGKEIDTLLIDVFDYNGSDCFEKHYVAETDRNAVFVDVTPNWVGNELSEEEMPETVVCPHCKQFPFESEEIQVYNFTRLVFFKSLNENRKNKGGQHMADYNKLIKRLRVGVEVFEVKGCRLEIKPETCTEIADAMEQLVRERDAAISQICQGCDNCKYRDIKIGEPCISCSTYRVDSDFIKSNWKWRGIQWR